MACPALSFLILWKDSRREGYVPRCGRNCRSTRRCWAQPRLGTGRTKDCFCPDHRDSHGDNNAECTCNADEHYPDLARDA